MLKTLIQLSKSLKARNHFYIEYFRILFTPKFINQYYFLKLFTSHKIIIKKILRGNPEILDFLRGNKNF